MGRVEQRPNIISRDTLDTVRWHEGSKDAMAKMVLKDVVADLTAYGVSPYDILHHLQEEARSLDQQLKGRGE